MSFALADETPVQPQIESVGLFKNGVAVVKASFTVPGPGSYRWDAIPKAVHGTFSVDSEATLTTRATHRMIEEEFKTAQPGHSAGNVFPTTQLPGQLVVKHDEPDGFLQFHGPRRFKSPPGKPGIRPIRIRHPLPSRRKT